MPEQAAHGVELVSGYISLSVKYSGAKSQVKADLDNMVKDAHFAGDAAGEAYVDRFVNKVKPGYSKAADALSDPKWLTAHSSMGEEAAKAYVERFSQTMSRFPSVAQQHGERVGKALADGITLPFKAVNRVVNDVFGGMETVASKSLTSIGNHVRNLATGPMTQMLGAATLFGAAFSTIEKGWQLDTKIQDTQVQLQSFGGTTQDVAGFMQSVNDALKGTKYGFADVADAARSLFFEGQRGDELTKTLKQMENIADSTGGSIEKILDLYEKAHGRDVIAPMMMGQLQMAGVPAREELKKAYGVDDATLDVMIKAGQVGFDKLWDQLGQDSEGAAERMSHTWSGQMHKISVDIAKVGGDFLKPLVGSGGGLESLSSALDKADTWINAHQDQIKNWFKEAGNDLKITFEGVKNVLQWCEDHEDTVKVIAGAFAAWKITSTFLTGLSSVLTAMKVIAPLSVTAAGGMDGIAAAGAGAGGLVALGTALIQVATGLGAVVAVFSVLPVELQNWILGKTVPGYDPNKISQPSNQGQPGGGPTPPPGQPPVNYSPYVPVPQQPGPAGGAGTATPPIADPGAPQPAFSQNQYGMPEGTYAYGGFHLPSQAKIQSSVHPGGLVNWAEPSTGGEAFIPLHSSKRSQSLKIWHQTGSILLGGNAFRSTRGGSRSYFSSMGIHTMAGGGFSPDANAQESTSYLPIDEAQLAWWLTKPGWNAYKMWRLTGDRPGNDSAIQARIPKELLDQMGWGRYNDNIQPRLTNMFQRVQHAASGGILSFADGGIRNDSGVLQVIFDNTATGQKTGEAAGYGLVGPGTSQPQYYGADWAGHTGHVHTAFDKSPLTGEPYGLPKGSELHDPGMAGFPTWVRALGAQYGVYGTTYSGHQEKSGFNRGIDWWPMGAKQDMSGASYTPEQRQRLQNFASAMASLGSSGRAAPNQMSPFAGRSGSSENVADAPGGEPRFRVSGGRVSISWGGSGLSGIPSMGGGGRGSGFATGYGAFGGGGPPLDTGTGSSGVGSGSSGGVPSGPTPAWGTTKPTADAAVAAIVAEGRRRGYTDDQIAWVVADATGESGLNPDITNKSGHHGLFQQDSGYPNRGTMEGQISGFYDRLDATNSGMSIGDRIAKSPAEGGVEGGGYGSEWIQQFLPQATSAVSAIGGTPAVGLDSTSTLATLTPQQEAANAAAIAAADSKTQKLEGDLQVAEERLEEARAKPVGQRPTNLTPEEQAAMERAVGAAPASAKAQAAHDAMVQKREEAVAKIRGDIQQAGMDRDNLDNLALGGNKAIDIATNRVNDALQRQHDAEQQLKNDEDAKAPPSKITADHNAIARAVDAVTRAKAHQQDVERKAQQPKRHKGSRGGADDYAAPGDWNAFFGSSDRQPDFGQLADIGMKGITESFLPPGFINPFDTGLAKAGSGLLKFLGGMFSGPGQLQGTPLGPVLTMLGGAVGGSPGAGLSNLISFIQHPAGTLQSGSPGNAPGVYDMSSSVVPGGSAGGVPVSPSALPGVNTVLQAIGGGPTGSPPGPTDGQPGSSYTVDLRGANFQGDPGGVKGTLSDQHLAYQRKGAQFQPSSINMPGSQP